MKSKSNAEQFSDRPAYSTEGPRQVWRRGTNCGHQDADLPELYEHKTDRGPRFYVATKFRYTKRDMTLEEVCCKTAHYESACDAWEAWEQQYPAIEKADTPT